MKLSVVIATLGGIPLKKTIRALQNSSIKPTEILICIPNSTELVETIDFSDNIKIIRTKKKGQVFQRMTGFLAAKGELVLQIDDDVFLEKDTIKRLVNCLDSLGKKAVVAPSIFKEGSNQSVFKRNKNTISSRITDWVMNGAIGFKPGIISLSGVGFGLDFNDKKQYISESEWLPGGCILHQSQNLITQDYFPFEGKAYSEDLIHSLILRENGVKLYVCNNTTVYMETIPYPDSLIGLYRQYQASKYVVNIQRKGSFRVHFFYFLRLIKTIPRVIFYAVFSFLKK
jgi:glycosyltransferase involved in cell wall biosynthesis